MSDEMGKHIYLCARRDKYISMRVRGFITDSEVADAFIRLLSDAPDDESALNLCEGLPDWFREVFGQSLEELSAMNYYRRSFGIGDSRTSDEVHRDALRQQKLLVRLAPRIRTILLTTGGYGPAIN